MTHRQNLISGIPAWLTHAVFVFTALVTGASLQLNWFSRRWSPLSGSFRKYGEEWWSTDNMPLRLILCPLLVLIVFYLLRTGLRFAVRRLPLTESGKRTYVKHDHLLYTAFLLSTLGAVGANVGLLLQFVVFALGQLLLIGRLARSDAPESDGLGLFANSGFLVLFSISGFAALIYQVAWQRALFQSFGVNIESVTITVSLFMFGLGVGSLVGGMLSKRFPRRLPGLFILCEIIVGLFGIFSLKLIGNVAGMTIHASQLVTGLITYALLCVPTIFMGATLPILTAHLYRRYQNVGRSVSLLYFVNTLGSALASFATVFILFLYFGLQASVLVAVLFNFLVAWLAYRFTREESPDLPSPTPPPSSAVNPEKGNVVRYLAVLVLAAVSGFISLSQEILWIRIISYATGAKSYVFAVVVGAVLVGIALGSLKAKALCEKHARSIPGIIASMLVLSSLVYYVTIPLTAWLTALTGEAGMILMLLCAGYVAYLVGIIFPLLTHYAITSQHAVGFSLSWIYFANIVGATVGPLFTGFVLLEWFTLEQNVLLISVFALLSGSVVWLLSQRALPFPRRYAFWVVLLTLGAFAGHKVLYSRLFEKLYHKRAYASEKAFGQTHQNRHGIINIIPAADGDDIIVGGGAYDGRFNTDLVRNRNGIDRAYMFAALHLRPVKVLEIGLSSASWARVLADHPEVKSLDIVEIDPGYLSVVAPYPESQSVLDDPKVKTFIDDGRRWLKRNPEKKYDFILMNTTHHWRSQVNNLVSKEFLELCRQHLKPGGVLFYNTTGSEDIVFTAAHVFPYVGRYRNFVAGSDAPFPTDRERIRQNLLKFSYRGGPIDTGDVPLMKVIDEMASARVQINKQDLLVHGDLFNLITDDNLASEYKTGKKAFVPRRGWLQLLL